MKILVINGPNLNMLGIREPDHYGKETYADLIAKIERHCEMKGIEVKTYQSNHEGDLVDEIQNAYGIPLLKQLLVQIWLRSANLQSS